MDFRDLFSMVCISLSLVFTAPQAFRVVRHDTVEGISVASQVQGFVGSVLWIAYGLNAETYLVVAANVMTLVGVGVVLVKFIQHHVLRFVVATSIIAVATVGSAVAIVVSPTLLAIVAVLIGSTGIIPQVVRAARTSQLVGVSVATFLIITAMSTSWFLYGLMIDDLFVAAPNVIIAPCAMFIAVRAIRSHRRYSKTIEAEVVPAR